MPCLALKYSFLVCVSNFSPPRNTSVKLLLLCHALCSSKRSLIYSQFAHLCCVYQCRPRSFQPLSTYSELAPSLMRKADAAHTHRSETDLQIIGARCGTGRVHPWYTQTVQTDVCRGISRGGEGMERRGRNAETFPGVRSRAGGSGAGQGTGWGSGMLDLHPSRRRRAVLCSTPVRPSQGCPRSRPPARAPAEPRYRRLSSAKPTCLRPLPRARPPAALPCLPVPRSPRAGAGETSQPTAPSGMETALRSGTGQF